MDDSHSNGSPYINEIDLQPPSPAGSQQLGLYSTDYHNSPYSSHSDLSFGGDVQHSPALALFSDDGYDPTEFDNPNSGSSLLMFDGSASDDYYNYYRSPSPSNTSDNNHEENPSGASSASSNNTHFSPNLAMAHSFENLSFQSPNWNPDPLPPMTKAASPPRLMIADQQVPIVVNAPDDNTEMGPSLNVVPATPIGGIGAVNMVNQQQPQTSNWLEPGAQSGFSSRSVSPAHSGATTPGPSRSPSASPQPNQLILDPQPPRSRSRSDTNVEPPNWDNISGGDGYPQNHPSQQAYQGATAHPPTLGANFSFGGQASNGAINSAPTNNGFLSPEYPEFNLTGLRRSKSDAGGPGLIRHRGSRSEDFRFSDQYLPAAGQAGQGLNFPPSAHNDFIRSQQLQQTQQMQPQFLQPEMMRPSHSHSQSLSAPYPSHVPNITGSPNLSANNNRHYRRASSGTRSERGPSAGDWDGGLGHSNRASPYPSPHASPRGRPLPLIQDDYNFNGMAGGLTADMAANLGPKLPNSGGGYIHVSKPNVTTVRTVNASQKRRKQEATFVCPVPGCNSTFTRSFNLKGHIRSHNEEKPFQCHWPGCGKGFARQHDCKRHEQLHTNYRPFNCDGCKKQFARMDALNRHLRSEGGAECAKLQEANGGSTSATTASSSPPGSAAKTEPSAAGIKSSSSTSGTTLYSDAPSNDTMTNYTTRQTAGLRSGRPKMEDTWGVGALAVAL